MSRRTPRPVPPLALPLFVLALAVFWLSLGLGEHLWPVQLQKQQTLQWPESARHNVRRVVLQTPAWHWHETELEWSDKEPSVEVDADRSGQLSWQLAREGDTLYVRLSPPAEAQTKEPGPRTYVKKIVLPPGVDTVQGRRLAVSMPEAAPSPTHMPPRLTLQGAAIELDSGAELEHLHISALAEKEECTVGPGDVRVSTWKTDDTRVRINAPLAKQLLIEAKDSRINLDRLHPDARVQLRTDPRTRLELGDVAQLPHIEWQPLPEERAQALQQQLKTVTSARCPRDTSSEAEHQSP